MAELLDLYHENEINKEVISYLVIAMYNLQNGAMYWRKGFEDNPDDFQLSLMFKSNTGFPLRKAENDKPSKMVIERLSEYFHKSLKFKAEENVDDFCTMFGLDKEYVTKTLNENGREQEDNK